ncbi:MAG TPA: phosphodiester glycosidase family protein [Armatimonadaceae bacterium]|nr:phosphodiester glycosidase family protein [Armatimonadaceae bacterium]
MALVGTAHGGCGPASGRERVDVAEGVTFRSEADGFQLLEVDLSVARVRARVVADNVQRLRNNFVGDARTVSEWARREPGAVGGVNGGFFGDTYDEVGQRKQIVQLALVAGKVVAPGSDTASARQPGQRYLRSAVGFHADGTPEIAWAIGTVRNVVKRYDAPVNPLPGSPWPVRSAVACGPRLFAGGELRIADGEERLASPGALSRAFVAYDLVDGRPRHLVLGRADAAEYADVARFLRGHFYRRFGTRVEEAMCLDGGPSAQVVYRDGPRGVLRDAVPTGVRVPTAILLVEP